MKDTVFTLFWKDGKVETASGSSIGKAFMKAGYSAGAMSALDFFSEKENAADDYNYISEINQWVRKQG